jgi:ATP-dependent RNA helicase DeaD
MFSKSPSDLDDKIVRLLHQAGYVKPTPLQEKVIPIVLKGKDIAVEAGERTGKTASFVLPLLSMLESGGGGTKIITISSTFEQSKKIFREFRKFTRQKGFAFSLLLLGDEAGKRDEFRALTKGPDIVIGTSKTIIDHIRRGNFSFDRLSGIVIDVPGAEAIEGFEQDIHFITHKLPDKRQTLLFSPVELSKIDGFLSVLRRPVTITNKEWKDGRVRPKYVFYPADGLGEKDKLPLVLGCMLARKVRSLLVFCQKKQTATELSEYLSKHGYKTGIYSHEGTEPEKIDLIKSFNNGKLDVIASTHIAVQNERYIAPTHVLYFDVPEKLEEYIDCIYTESQKTEEVLSFVRTSDFEKLLLSEDIKNMNPKMDHLPTDDDMMRGLTQKILASIKEDGSPEDLDRYTKIIRKNVSIFSRSSFAGYLLRELYGKKMGKPIAVHAQKGTTLFISIGKNRKVFPQDLIDLFTTNLNVKQSEIKEIKILDNYSFLDISPQHSDNAIKKLNGIEFKGKKITVNLARKKEPRSRQRPLPR